MFYHNNKSGIANVFFNQSIFPGNIFISLKISLPKIEIKWYNSQTNIRSILLRECTPWRYWTNPLTWLPYLILKVRSCHSNSSTKERLYKLKKLWNLTKKDWQETKELFLSASIMAGTYMNSNSNWIATSGFSLRNELLWI